MTVNELSKLRQRTAKELLEMNFAPREYIIEPWLRNGETAVVWSDTGLGKTMLCLSLAIAVAGGGSVAGWSGPEPKNVLYIDGEMNLQDIRDRISSLIVSNAVMNLDHSVVLENLTIIARQDQNIGSDFYDITDVDSQREIVRLIKELSPNLVILDNFTTLTDGLEDENAATEFKSAQSFFLELKRTGVATILVHHSNKDGKQMRGSTALATTFEVIIGLEKPAIPTPGEANFVLSFGKFRAKGDSSIERREWHLKDQGWETSMSEPDQLTDDAVYQALISCKYISQIEIADKLQINKSTVSRRLRKLQVLGLLKDSEVEGYFGKATDIRNNPEYCEVEDEIW